MIIARENDSLEDITSTSYPYVTDHEKIDDCIEQIKDYAEDSIPVLTQEKHLIGVITAQDLEETTVESMKKRLPWLIILLFLGTLIPMFFHKIKVDPAVASGSLITTVNDLVAVVVYYGLVWILLINFLHMI